MGWKKDNANDIYQYLKSWEEKGYDLEEIFYVVDNLIPSDYMTLEEIYYNKGEYEGIEKINGEWKQK